MLKKIYTKANKFKEFIEGDEAKHKDKMIKYSNVLTIDEQLREEITSLSIKTKILVFGELWCPDCTLNISALEIMNKLNNKIEFKIIEREGYEDTIKEITNSDTIKIPTIIVMDKHYNVKGLFIERPKEILELENETDQIKRIVKMREYRNGLYIGETIKEIIEIINS